MRADEALRSLLEECGRERCRLAMDNAQLRKDNDTMRQLLQAAVVYLWYYKPDSAHEVVQVRSLIDRIQALGGDRTKRKVADG